MKWYFSGTSISFQILKNVTNVPWKPFHIRQCCTWRILPSEMMASTPLRYTSTSWTLWPARPGTIVTFAALFLSCVPMIGLFSPSEISLLLFLSRFSRVRLCATPETEPTGFPVPGILQARTLEWVSLLHLLYIQKKLRRYPVNINSLTEWMNTPQVCLHSMSLSHSTSPLAWTGQEMIFLQKPQTGKKTKNYRQT